jgi:hypothetical protein
MRKRTILILTIIICGLLAGTPVALADGTSSPGATGSSTPEIRRNPTPSALSIAVIGTCNLELSVGQILTELGYSYDYYEVAFPPDYSVYDLIIQGMDGGTVTQIPELATYISAGGCAIILGGSYYEPFVLDVDAHLMDVDELNYGWTTVVGSPHITVIDPGHPLAVGLPSTYDFVDLGATYYMLRILDPLAYPVAENGDGYKAIVTKELGDGKFTWFINSPYDSYWADPGDYSYLKTYLGNAIDWCARPPFQHSLRLNPFTDVVHFNLVMPDKWIYGINEAGYSVPILGKAGGGMVYWACDLPAGGIEMYFVEINIATRDGYMYRIHDDMSLTGPDYVWLTPVTGEAEGVSADDAMAAESSPQSVHTFQLNPYIDIVYLYDDIVPWLYGYHDVEGNPAFPAPMLGYAGGGRFYWGTDFVDGSGGYELLFLAGSVGGKDGYIIRTTDGYSYAPPTYVWLTPAGYGETYKGTLAEID